MIYVNQELNLLCSLRLCMTCPECYCAQLQIAGIDQKKVQKLF